MTTVPSATNSPPSTVDQAASASATGLNADFNMFLKLLTAQMQNQDPLDPMDSSQYTQQLVQYSQVEQSIKQNATLGSILTSLGNQGLTQASSMIGKTVEVNSDTSGLNATTPAQWNWYGSAVVGDLTATITDASGATVETRKIDAGSRTGSFSWDGSITGSEKIAPEGVYTLTLAGLDASGNKVTVSPWATGTVNNVQMVNGVVQLSINGAEYASDSVSRIEK
ncbi:flagellar hook capping FlgD N-terminal domain-containing protein [Sphingomonas sp. dw_22]|uniref:flagellar hook assembly protein FlgD n=1 Tax=Sphingomonas sp. dw_22 TaxID=2721175 RepID=UPI001BD5ACB1|nr:flagellar hook capping FlgD N-terminal domain-containing protein [Sphingomonas sp. dw_22]